MNNKSEIASVCASRFQWTEGLGIANSSDLFGKIGFRDNELLVKSPKTGIVKRFTLDLVEAENKEFWDGEFTVLRDENKDLAIKIWNY